VYEFIFDTLSLLYIQELDPWSLQKRPSSLLGLVRQVGLYLSILLINPQESKSERKIQDELSISQLVKILYSKQPKYILFAARELGRRASGT
jgi:hypothetical protein